MYLEKNGLRVNFLYCFIKTIIHLNFLFLPSTQVCIELGSLKVWNGMCLEGCQFTKVMWLCVLCSQRLKMDLMLDIVYFGPKIMVWHWWSGQAAGTSIFFIYCIKSGVGGFLGGREKVKTWKYNILWAFLSCLIWFDLITNWPKVIITVDSLSRHMTPLALFLKTLLIGENSWIHRMPVQIPQRSRMKG